MIIIITILIYFVFLLLISKLTAGSRTDNDTFFRANGQSKWYLVAFGMIGASISGVTFVSVPGMVVKGDMTYLQTCLGFVVGYVVVAFFLLPVYYRLRLTTIYAYLSERLGRRSYKTGASFFLLSKLIGAAVRFYVVCMILQRFVLDAYNVPFFITVLGLILLIWLYTRRSGIRTLVWTDTFQTLCMLGALILIIYQLIDHLGLTLSSATQAIVANSHSHIFVWDDWFSPQNFWKQFFSGIFIVIVMTGLDQDMMQKNLTCKTLREAQKDMCTYGCAFVPINLLFLSLGILLLMFYHQQQLALPLQSDEMMLQTVAGGMLGKGIVVLFTIGIVAACFSSADSALTALTTSFCVDLCQRKDDENFRKWSHFGISLVFALFILLFRFFNSTSLIDAIYIICSYTYGPLLGLFAFGLFTHRRVSERFIPHICICSPFLCYALDQAVSSTIGYKFGYELLMVNGGLVFLGCYLSSHSAQPPVVCEKR